MADEKLRTWTVTIVATVTVSEKLKPRFNYQGEVCGFTNEAGEDVDIWPTTEVAERDVPADLERDGLEITEIVSVDYEEDDDEESA